VVGPNYASKREQSSAAIGSLTLDNFYLFDFATAGIGTTVFRSNTMHRPLALFVDNDMPRAAGVWTYEPRRLDPVSFAGSPVFSTGRNWLSTSENEPLDAFQPVLPIPEPGTWIGAMLALGAIAFTQRRRLRRSARG